MTRFARAKGSNAFNKKVPNDATPWSQMRSLPSNKSSSNGDQPKQVVKINWRMKKSEEGAHILGLPTNESLTGVNGDNTKRKRPLRDHSSSIEGSNETGIVRFEGFPVRKEDAIRLKELKKKLLTSKVPHHEIKRTMQLERRRAEKVLSREKKQVCFHCRQSGHILSQCPNLNNDNDIDLMPESGICFKCGSTEHQHTQCRVVRGDNYKFATCFICKQEGHISKQCPDNPRGLYPEGGSCRICGDVTHLKKDCPRFGKKKKAFEVTLSTLDSTKLEVLDENNYEIKQAVINSSQKKKRKIIKM